MNPYSGEAVPALDLKVCQCSSDGDQGQCCEHQHAGLTRQHGQVERQARRGGFAGQDGSRGDETEGEGGEQDPPPWDL